MKGRKPKPLSIHKLAGTFREDRHGGKSPQPQSGTEPPDCPEHLEGLARETWEHLAPVLHGVGCLSDADLRLLETYCRTYEHWRAAEKHLATHGAVVKSPNGFAVLSPYVGIARNAIKTLTVLGAELGLSPSSRARLRIQPPEKDKDSFEEYLKEHA